MLSFYFANYPKPYSLLFAILYTNLGRYSITFNSGDDFVGFFSDFFNRKTIFLNFLNNIIFSKSSEPVKKQNTILSFDFELCGKKQDVAKI